MNPSVEVREALTRALDSAVEAARAGMAGAPRELERAAREVLSGSRSGRRTKLAGGGAYRASAPGEPPARRTGGYASSWTAQPVREERSGDALRWTAELSTSMPERALRLEHGAGGLAARPHMRRILEDAAASVAARMRGGG